MISNVYFLTLSLSYYCLCILEYLYLSCQDDKYLSILFIIQSSRVGEGIMLAFHTSTSLKTDRKLRIRIYV